MNSARDTQSPCGRLHQRGLSTLSVGLIVAILVLLDLANRLISISAGQFPFERDALDYWNLGEQMASGDWLLLANPQLRRTPGYPALIAIVQLIFGEWALLATVTLQHLMGVTTSLLTGWLCGNVTRRREAFIAGYVFSCMCLARTQLANWVMPETLFVLVLVVHLVFWVRFYQRASHQSTIGAGVSLGIMILIRPVAQLLWVPELLVLFVWLYHQSQVADRWNVMRHALIFLGCISVVVLPWVVRNYALSEEIFLTKFLGRNLWLAAIELEGAKLPLPASPEAERLRLAMSDTAEHTNSWALHGSLVRSGLSEGRADDLLKTVAVQAIREHPLEFAFSALRNFAIYWFTIKEAFPWYPRHRPWSVEAYLGQREWHNDFLTAPVEKPLRFFYRYSKWHSGVVSALAFMGAIALALRRRTRPQGLLLLLSMLYFASVISVVELPVYRYRAVVEPVMIIAVVAILFRLPYLYERWTYKA
jgi:4-amino-4-deoxy-L-arabinose transferase-like glycosyltransferase